ncbi:MAG: hypothetical protein ACM3NF_01765 [Gemmatimonadota bacterium]
MGAGLFLAAAGVLAFEVLLTRVFSVLMWYHFASMAIAIAMFGLSVGGLLPYLLRRRGEWPPFARAWLCGASLVFAAAPYAVLLAFARYPLWAGRLLAVFHQPYFEPFRTAGGRVPPAGDAVQIGLLLILFSLPFVGAGAVFAMAFSERGREGKTYLAVMGGSAAGVVAYLAAMQGGSGPAAFPFVASLFAFAAAAFAAAAGDPGRKRGKSAAWLFVGVAAALVVAGAAEIRTGAAEIRFVRGRYEPDLLWTRWDANSRVAVYPVSAEEAARSWGLSPAYAGPVPPQLGMVVDDTGYTALFGVGRDPASLAAFRHNVASAAYRVRERGAALAIGPGGGKDILCALSPGGFAVTAVEVNPLVVRAAEREFGEFTGRPYAMPGVREVVAEGRNFVAGDPSRYDVIQLTQVFGRIPPSAGAFTMTEDHLYTVEAFREFLSRLSDDGILTVTRFAYERRVWRILAIAREALRAAGERDASRHVVVIRDRGLVNILVRRTAWPAGELDAVRRFAGEMGFEVPVAPDAQAGGLPGRILAGTEPVEAGPFDWSAPTDDRPFFYYTLSPRWFLAASPPSGGEFEDRAVTMMRGFLLSAAVLCAAFLLLPAGVLSRGDPDRPSVGASLYMFLVGIAYVAWEIVMIRKLTLLFGTPVVSFAAGLTMILAFSALGGYLAGREGASPAGGGLVVAAALVSGYLFVMDGMIGSLAGAPSALRWTAAAAYLLPPGILMGRFFPLGLKAFGKPGGGPVPFYFAANGAASVLGAALSQAMAMNLGYRVTTGFGALLYIACALVVVRAGKGP